MFQTSKFPPSARHARLAFAFALGLSMFPALSAMAAPVESAPNDDADAAARISSTEYVFVEGDSLEGETLSPGGTHINGPRTTNFESLISIRVSFNDRLTSLTREM